MAMNLQMLVTNLDLDNMKQLQRNFTTPEQSKRLLELGVPAWTADCFLPTDLQQNIIQDATPTIITYQLDTKEIVWDKVYGFPCWSVGRLIEIYEICTQTKFNRRNQTDNLVYLSPIEDVMMQIEHNACGFYDNTKWDINLLNG